MVVLRVFEDRNEHSADEVQELMKARFRTSAQELLEKTDRGNLIFRNNVALALASLQGAPNIQLEYIHEIREGELIYKITGLGESLLKLNPQSLTIKDLKSFTPPPAI